MLVISKAKPNFNELKHNVYPRLRKIFNELFIIYLPLFCVFASLFRKAGEALGSIASCREGMDLIYKQNYHGPIVPPAYEK